MDFESSLFQKRQDIPRRWKRLEAFEQLTQNHPEWLSANEQAFVSASRDAYQAQIEREEQSRRRLKRLTRIALAADAMLAVVAAAAVWQWQNAKVQRNRAEAAVTKATQAANSLIFDMAQKFRYRVYRLKSLATSLIVPKSCKPSSSNRARLYPPSA
jgi:hypothetical protein